MSDSQVLTLRHNQVLIKFGASNPNEIVLLPVSFSVILDSVIVPSYARV